MAENRPREPPVEALLARFEKGSSGCTASYAQAPRHPTGETVPSPDARAIR